MTTKKTIIDSTFYCNQKFWWLSVDIEKSNTLSCCAAAPERIDLEWLENNPGQLFNTLSLQQERTDMLQGIPVKSCYATCWKAESNNLPSRRIHLKGDKVTHTNITSIPETLHIIVGSNCNMTCVYCCKQYSSAWRNDIITNGNYSTTTNDDRFVLNTSDRILVKLGQKDIANTQMNAILLHELGILADNTSIKEIQINGGETFLYLFLSQLVEALPSTVLIKIWTGLGVDKKRFSRELDKLKKFPNIQLVISAENIGQSYEFNRYGNTWQQFQDNLNYIKDSGISYKFNATISNLTVFGLVDFYSFVGSAEVQFEPCTDPEFLSINTMDDASRATVVDSVDSLPGDIKNLILTSLQQPVEELSRVNLKSYLVEFAQRRNLTLDCFPKSFITWIMQ